MGFFANIFGRPKRQAPEPLQHPGLGELVWNQDGWWEGSVDHQGTPVAVSVGGDEAGPRPDMATAAVATLSVLEDNSQKAVRFLLADLPKLGARIEPSQFTLKGVCHLWLDRPQDFWREFDLEGDPHAIWRVEFEDGNPRYSGRDD